jgi:lipid-A-disaccharide synthase
MRQLFIVAGEASGDLQASLLVKEIKKLKPEIKFSGYGGKLLQEQGVNILRDLTQEAVTGFTEVIKKIPFFKKVLKEALLEIKRIKPQAVIFVDFPGFNLRLMPEVKKLGIKTIYYISPQIWAWGRKRVETMKRYADLIIVFFKFEEEFYRQYGIEVRFVGHPLVELVKPELKLDEFLDKYNLDSDKKRIFLMPGSRENEIRRHLPVIISALKKLDSKQLDFLLLKSPYIKNSISIKTDFPIKIISEYTYSALFYSYAGIVASGTATLEAALALKPFMVVYKTSFLNYLILRPQIKVPYIGMVNLVADKQVVKEFIQKKFKPHMIKDELEKLINDNEYYVKIQQELEIVKEKLGPPGAEKRAAKYILEFLT